MKISLWIVSGELWAVNILRCDCSAVSCGWWMFCGDELRAMNILRGEFSAVNCGWWMFPAMNVPLWILCGECSPLWMFRGELWAGNVPLGEFSAVNCGRWIFLKPSISDGSAIFISKSINSYHNGNINSSNLYIPLNPKLYDIDRSWKPLRMNHLRRRATWQGLEGHLPDSEDPRGVLRQRLRPYREHD